MKTRIERMNLETIATLERKRENDSLSQPETGITLVALVVTIVVLLILAGITIVYVFGENGVFGQASEAKEKTAIAKAREKLELLLVDAQMKKYESGLTDEQLTQKINEVGEEIEERENPNISQAIVDGYIFSVDRTVPKILAYVGKEDEKIIITASVTQNDYWKNPVATITGKIKTYSGGNITTVTATNSDGTQRTDFTINSLDENGRYTIDNITSDTTITISATDSNGKTNSKEVTVKVIIKKDTTAPTIEAINTEVDGLKMKISVIGNDKNASGEEESGIEYYQYSMSSYRFFRLENWRFKFRRNT